MKIVQIFLYASQGKTNVFPIFTRLLGTSRSLYWSPQVLQRLCFDSSTLQLIQAFELTGVGGGESQTIVSPTTPPGSASHTKGTFTSSKTLQQNLHRAVSDDLVAFSCKLVPPVFSPSCFLFVGLFWVCFVFFASD